MKILVVDDSELIRLRLVRQLEAIPGIEQVLTASGCMVAKNMLGTMPPGLAVVVLDSHLPDGDPVCLIQKFKAQHLGLKVVVLTNDVTDYNRQRCLEKGADGFFDKSTEFEQLLARLRQLSDTAFPRSSS